VKFTENNKLLSCGGGDLTIIQWALEDNDKDLYPPRSPSSLSVSLTPRSASPSNAPKSPRALTSTSKATTQQSAPKSPRASSSTMAPKSPRSSSTITPQINVQTPQTVMKILVQFNEYKTILQLKLNDEASCKFESVSSIIREDFEIATTSTLDITYFDKEMESDIHIRNERHWQTYLDLIKMAQYAKDMSLKITLK